jgi:hypothetical protein
MFFGLWLITSAFSVQLSAVPTEDACKSLAAIFIEKLQTSTPKMFAKDKYGLYCIPTGPTMAIPVPMPQKTPTNSY